METSLWLLHVADLNENKLILGFYHCGIDEYGATINYVGEVRHNSFFSHLFDAKKVYVRAGGGGDGILLFRLNTITKRRT